jgi:hypothetical protein
MPPGQSSSVPPANTVDLTGLSDAPSDGDCGADGTSPTSVEPEPKDDLAFTNAEDALRRAHFEELARQWVRSSFRVELDNEAFDRYVKERMQTLIDNDDRTRGMGEGDLDPIDMMAVNEDHNDKFEALRTILEDSPALAHMDTAMWDGTRAFYRVDPVDLGAAIAIQRLRRRIFPYQLQGAFFMLLRWADFEGCLLQDEQGLGKTTTTIVFAASFSWLAFLWGSLRNDPANHLNKPQASDRCPFAQQNLIPIACPCEHGFPAVVKRKLRHTKTVRGFQAFVVPPSVITNWVLEFQAILDFDFRKSGPVIAPAFELRVAHEIGDRRELSLNAAFTRRLLTGQDGRAPENISNIFVLTASKSILSRLITVIDDAWEKKAKRINTDLPILRFGCCACYIDEAHTFRNPGRITEFLYNAPDFEDTPLYVGALFLITGTPWEKGPDDMAIWMRWYRRRWAYISSAYEGGHWLDDTTDRDKRCSRKNIQAMHRSIAWYQRESLKPQADAGKIQAGLRSVAQDLLDFFLLFSLRRDTSTKWYNGLVLVALPTIDVRYERVEPASDAITAMLNNAFSAKLSEIQADYQVRLQDWRKYGKAAGRPMPQITDVAAAGVHCVRPLVSVPEFKAMLDEKILHGYTQAANPDLFNTSTLNVLLSSVDRMLASSRRFEHFLARIREICCGPPVSLTRQDGVAYTVTRKLVGLTAYPLVALSLYFVIRSAIDTHNLRGPDRRQLRVAACLGHMTRKERDRTIGAFNELIKTNNLGEVIRTAQGNLVFDHPDGADVLIGTLGTLGLGVNLQRADYMIILEPQLQHSATSQAIKRVHRIGQQRRTTVEILTSDTVQAERVVHDKRLLREAFSGLVQNAKASLDDAESEEDDEGIA